MNAASPSVRQKLKKSWRNGRRCSQHKQIVELVPVWVACLRVQEGAGALPHAAGMCFDQQVSLFGMLVCQSVSTRPPYAAQIAKYPSVGSRPALITLKSI